MCANFSLTDIEVANQFGFELKFTAKIARLSGAGTYEVPISYHGRRYAEKTGWRHRSPLAHY